MKPFNNLNETARAAVDGWVTRRMVVEQSGPSGWCPADLERFGWKVIHRAQDARIAATSRDERERLGEVISDFMPLIASP